MRTPRSGNPAASRPPLQAIALLSCTALAYEILLTRLFAMVHWHNLAAMVISLALLGYGASGTFLALTRRHLLGRFELAFVLNALLFAIATIGAYHLARQQPLNPLQLAWNPGQLLNLTKVYLLLSLPFFAVANCIALTLWRYPGHINRIYAADLVGAGAGAAGIVGLLYLQPPSEVLLTLAISGALAGSLGSLGFQGYKGLYLMAGVLAAIGIALSPPGWRAAPPGEYKDLAHSLSARGAVISGQSFHPLGVISIVDNSEAPLRHAPGLSIATPVAPPPVSALFLNGDLLGGIYHRATAHEHLSHLSSSLPYVLLDAPRTLLNGAGGGIAIAQALAMGAGRIDVVEPNPLLLRRLREDFHPPGKDTVGINPLPGTLRLQLRVSEQEYDLIQWSLADGMGDQAGLRAQRENHNYTREAFAAAFSRLAPSGLLAITRGLRLPPRGSLRMTALAIDALAERGIGDPGGHLAMIRGWNTVTLLISARPFTATQRQRIRAFCRRGMFDLVWLSDLQPDELNRYHKLESPRLYQGVTALLGPEPERFIHGYPFRIGPPTDNRPYFDHFTRTGNIREFVRQPAGAGLGHLDWGYALLWIALLLALFTSLLLILLPLAIRDGRKKPACGRGRGRTLLFFGAIGLAFLFVEIAFIQHLQLFLGHPIHAIVVVLGGFLVSAGIGSRIAGLFSVRFGVRRTLAVALAAVTLFAGCQLFGFAFLFDQLAHLGLITRVLLCLLLIAPLGMAMGMPFPLGLSQIGQAAPDLIPWAWGINGCASVISAISATLLAMEIGFSGVLMVACGLYLSAFASFPAADRMPDSSPGQPPNT